MTSMTMTQPGVTWRDHWPVTVIQYPRYLIEMTDIQSDQWYNVNDNDVLIVMMSDIQWNNDTVTMIVKPADPSQENDDNWYWWYSINWLTDEEVEEMKWC